MNRLLLNPFAIISLTFSLALVLYAFGWSTIYPDVNFKTSAPVVLFVFLNIISAIVWDTLKLYHFSLPNKPSVKINNFFFKVYSVSVFFIFLEIIIYGAPIFGMVKYTDFGAPILHVVVVSCFGLCSIFYGIKYFKYRCRSSLIKVCTLVILTLVMLNRFLLLVVILSLIFSRIVSNKASIKKIAFSLLLCFLALVGFGELGILRLTLMTDMPYEQARNYILEAGYASEDFKSLNVPVSFYWAWLYITSPLSNFFLNVSLNEYIPQINIFYLFINELSPETFSKRVVPILDMEPVNRELIVEHLNVSTALVATYISLGNLGVALYQVMLVSYIVIARFYLNGLPLLVFMIFSSVMSMFLIFHNVLKMPIWFFSILVLMCTRFRFRNGFEKKN